MARLDGETILPLLYVTPPGQVSIEPCNDELTIAMEAAFSTAETVQTWRGWHTCACGERSTNCDYMVAGCFTTNSLCVHYLRWHRDAVPARELNKVRGIAGLQLAPETDEPHAGVTFLGRPVGEWDPAELQRALDDVAVNSTWNPRSSPTPSRGLFQILRP